MVVGSGEEDDNFGNAGDGDTRFENEDDEDDDDDG